MTQKTYQLPKVGGSEVTVSLVPPTIKRMAGFLDLFGVKSFDELRTSNGQLDYAMFVLETGRDPEKLKKTLDICLIEGSANIDFDALDLRVSDEVIQDFFEQRSKTLLLRIKSQ